MFRWPEIELDSNCASVDWVRLCRLDRVGLAAASMVDSFVRRRRKFFRQVQTRELVLELVQDDFHALPERVAEHVRLAEFLRVQGLLDLCDREPLDGLLLQKVFRHVHGLVVHVQTDGGVVRKGMLFETAQGVLSAALDVGPHAVEPVEQVVGAPVDGAVEGDLLDVGRVVPVVVDQRDHLEGEVPFLQIPNDGKAALPDEEVPLVVLLVVPPDGGHGLFMELLPAHSLSDSLFFGLPPKSLHLLASFQRGSFFSFPRRKYILLWAGSQL